MTIKSKSKGRGVCWSPHAVLSGAVKSAQEKQEWAERRKERRTSHYEDGGVIWRPLLQWDQVAIKIKDKGAIYHLGKNPRNCQKEAFDYLLRLKRYLKRDNEAHKKTFSYIMLFFNTAYGSSTQQEKVRFTLKQLSTIRKLLEEAESNEQ